MRTSVDGIIEHKGINMPDTILYQAYLWGDYRIWMTVMTHMINIGLEGVLVIDRGMSIVCGKHAAGDGFRARRIQEV